MSSLPSSTRNKVRILFWCLALVSISIFVFSIYAQIRQQQARGVGRFEADKQAYAKLGGDFQLNTIDGSKRLSDYWHNRNILLNFGFTRCPDICPTTLARMQSALRKLTPQQRARVQVVFVSADPEYDTPARLNQYLRFFIEDGVGMTGSIDAIQAVTTQYGAYVHKVDLPDSALGYTVDHSARWYLIQPGGAIATTFNHDTPIDTIAKTLGFFADASF